MNDTERIVWLEQEVETLSRQVRWFNFLLQRGDQRKPYSKMKELDKAKWRWYKAKLDFEICKVLARWGQSSKDIQYDDYKSHEKLRRGIWEKLKQKARRKSEERR